MAKFTAKKIEGEKFEIFKDGQRISTGTKDVLSGFGLSETNLGTPAIETKIETTPTPGLSEKDIAAVRKAGEAGGLSREVSTDISLGKLPAVVTAPVSTTTQTPQLKEPEVGGAQDSFAASIQNTVDTSRKILDDRLKTEIEDIDKRIEDANKNIEELTTLEAEGIEDVGELLQPFRASLEESERERLFVNKNFRENQLLVDELGSLLTEGNELIRQQKEITGLGSIRNPRIDKTISDVNARAGVIEAVLNARNGQINQDFTMIDRTVNAITADKQDQLTYYETLLNFYENQKDTEGKKLVTLESDKKDFLESQITLLEGDLEQAETNAQNIKDQMTDPDTAAFMARAGVTLNDSPEKVAEKIATQKEFEKDKFTTTEVDGVKIITDASGKVVSTTKPTVTGGVDEPFGEKDLPGTVRQDIIDDLTDKEFALSDGELTLQDMARLYPDVQLDTLQDLMDRFYDFDSLVEGTEAEEPGFFEKGIKKVGDIAKSIGGFFGGGEE